MSHLALNLNFEEQAKAQIAFVQAETQSQDLALSGLFMDDATLDYLENEILSPAERIELGLSAFPEIAVQAVENVPEVAETPDPLGLLKEKSPSQLELFAKVPKSIYYAVEDLLKHLPDFAQNYYRKIYLKNLKALKDDGSIAFLAGNVQRSHAWEKLNEALNTELKKVLDHHNVDLFLLSDNFHDKAEWAKAYLGKNSRLFEYDFSQEHDETLFTRENPFKEYWEKEAEKRYSKNHENRIPFYLIPPSRFLSIAKEVARLFEHIQVGFFTDLADSGKTFTDAEIEQALERIYTQCGELCEQMGFAAPYWQSYKARTEEGKSVNDKEMMKSLNRIASEKYWLKLFLKRQEQMMEHLRIACGEVFAKRSPYVSQAAYKRAEEKHRKMEAFIKNSILINVENEEEQVDLYELWFKSNSNPTIRRYEMMTRLRGVEEWAEENGWQALFLTLTAPSAYHAMHSHGRRNRKWQGADPRTTQAYLNKVWAQFRALLAKRKIDFKGMRVTEPHHDGTPHWHLLFYVKKEHIDEVEMLFKRKALEVDGDEAGASEHRCKVERCDKEKGSATAYIVKYVSKNIGGFGIDAEGADTVSDEAPQLKTNENARRVRAWAGLWCLRQFQFYGIGSVTVWRELRRCTEEQVAGDQLLLNLQAITDVSCYASFIDIQANKDKSDKAPVKTYYVETNNNSYGEMQRKVMGVFNRLSDRTVISRLKQYRIEKKKDEQTEFKTLTALAVEVQKNTGRSPAWTCVNNCNPIKEVKKPTKAEPEETYIQKTVRNFINEHEHEYNRLDHALKMRGIDDNLISDLGKMNLIKGAEYTVHGLTRLKYVKGYNGFNLWMKYVRDPNADWELA